jgi:rRNA maturation RNase YbeY
MTKMVRERTKKLCVALGSELTSEFSLLLTDDQESHRLNSQFRKKDKPTDVLSFPSGNESYLGDLVISIETAKAQAKEYGCSLLDELSRLIIHGLLHLLGYDHEKVAPSIARKMRQKEELLMKEILR